MLDLLHRRLCLDFYHYAHYVHLLYAGNVRFFGPEDPVAEKLAQAAPVGPGKDMETSLLAMFEIDVYDTCERRIVVESPFLNLMVVEPYIIVADQKTEQRMRGSIGLYGHNSVVASPARAPRPVRAY